MTPSLGLCGQGVLPLEGLAVQTALDVVTRVVDVEGLTCRLEVSTVSASTILLMTAIWFPRDADGIDEIVGTDRPVGEEDHRIQAQATGPGKACGGGNRVDGVHAVAFQVALRLRVKDD